MGYLFKSPADMMMSSPPQPPVRALDLALPKPISQPRVTTTSQSVSHPTIPHPIYCNSLALSKIPMSMAASMSSMPAMTPLPILPAMTPDSVRETAARLLFMNVSWTRDLVTSAGLTIEDQLTLLESSWRELFLLGAAQMVPTLDPSALVPPGPQNLPLAVQVTRFRETLTGFHAMNLDYHEYACIKAIVLFKAGLDSELVPSSRSSSGSASPSSASKLRDPAAVARLHYGAQIALGQRLNGASFGELRFGKLLMLLPTLRSVSAHAIEELFFRSTIGRIPIERIICDMYKKT